MGNPAALDRRRHLRLLAPVGLRASLADRNRSLTVIDISSGGLLVQSSEPIKREAVCDIRLTYGPLVVRARARAVHCRRVPSGAFAVGLQLVSQARGKQATIDDLIDRLEASMISFG